MRKSKASDELKARIQTAQAQMAAGQAVTDPELIKLASRLESGQQRLCDSTLYATRDVSGQTTVKMFNPQDSLDKGITNVANAKLAKGQVFLVGSIVLLAATTNGAPGAIGRDNLCRLNFGSIEDINGLASGEFTVRYKGKNLFDKKAMQAFVTGQDTRVQLGEFVLDNVLLMREDDPFEFNIETGLALPAQTGLRVVFKGASVVAS